MRWDNFYNWIYRGTRAHILDWISGHVMRVVYLSIITILSLLVLYLGVTRYAVQYHADQCDNLLSAIQEELTDVSRSE